MSLLSIISSLAYLVQRTSYLVFFYLKKKQIARHILITVFIPTNTLCSLSQWLIANLFHEQNLTQKTESSY